MPARLTHEEFVNRLHEKNPQLIVVGDYKGQHTGIQIQCRICGETWSPLPTNIIKNGNCPYCTGKRVITGKNDLATKRPDLVAEWDYSKNIDLIPENIPEFSNKRVWWKCSLGHEWPATIINRTKQKSGCPVCGGKVVLKGFNDLASVRPDLLEEWDFEKNKILPDITYAHSHKEVFWKCQFGHRWKTRIHYRVDRGFGCSECAKYFNTSFAEQAIYYYIKELYPTACNRSTDIGVELDIYIPEIKTGIEYDGIWTHRPKSRLVRDNKKDKACLNKGVRLIRIRDEGLEKTDSAYNIVRYKPSDIKTLNQCITELLDVLSNTKNTVLVDVEKDALSIRQLYYHYIKQNNVETLYPEIAKQWHPYKNKNITPQMVTPGSAVKVYWLCDKGHTYYTEVDKRCKRGYGCYYCSGQRVLKGYNDLATVRPDLAREWSDNNSIKPSEVTSGRNKPKYKWICPLGHEYEASIVQRARGCGCSVCSGRQLLRGYNDLATKCPDLVKEWSPRNEKMPYEYKASSDEKVFWICPKCQQEYPMTIKHRARGQGCTFCARNKLIRGVNDLQTVNPVLASQWDSEKNGDLTPGDVVANKNARAWWICPKCGDSWYALISSRNRAKGIYCSSCNKKLKK